jgi:uncharacterized membrane protein YfcA
MDMLQLAVLAFGVMAASVIKNGAGVGAGIFLLPVLAFVFPPKVALGLGAPAMLVGDLMGIRNYWGEWDEWGSILRVILAASVGIVVGGLLLQFMSASVFKKSIGVYAVCFAAFRLSKDLGLLGKPAGKRAFKLPGGDVASSLGIGFFGGITTALAHAGGVVWSIYYAGRGLEKRRFVGTIILLFALSNFVKFITYIKLDLLSWNSTLIVLAMTPLIIFGSNLGNRINKGMSNVVFRRSVLSLILVLGATLLF